MKRITNAAVAAVIVLLLCGCATLFDTTVTMTEVVDSAMKQWASLSVAGRTTQELDTAVVTAHREYRKAAAVARDALARYKAGGEEADYIRALEATRVAVNAILDAITPLLAPQKSDELKTAAGKASAP